MHAAELTVATDSAKSEETGTGTTTGAKLDVDNGGRAADDMVTFAKKKPVELEVPVFS